MEQFHASKPVYILEEYLALKQQAEHERLKVNKLPHFFA